MVKKRLFGCLVVVLLSITGCNNGQQIDTDTIIVTSEEQGIKDNDQMETDNIAAISKICSDIYVEAI